MIALTPSEHFLANPLGVSPTAKLLGQQLAELPDWEQRYAAVIALGDHIPPLAEGDKIDANLLHGCQATVWVVHHVDPVTGLLYFLCDSDSRIVRGLLACLLCLYNAQKPADILSIQAKPWLEEVGLVRHIASTRSNGLWAMLGKMKAVASRY